MRFDLTDLRLFLHVAEARSLTQGAGVFAPGAGIGERAHSRHGGAARRRLAQARPARRASSPPPGPAGLDWARIILQQVEGDARRLVGLARGLKGRVHVLSNTVALSEHLPDVLASFLVSQSEHRHRARGARERRLSWPPSRPAPPISASPNDRPRAGRQFGAVSVPAPIASR